MGKSGWSLLIANELYAPHGDDLLQICPRIVSKCSLFTDPVVNIQCRMGKRISYRKGYERITKREITCESLNLRKYCKHPGPVGEAEGLAGCGMEEEEWAREG